MSQRIAYGMDEAAETAGIGLTKLREEIAAKRLRARKLGSRTIITRDDLVDWAARLPDIRRTPWRSASRVRKYLTHEKADADHVEIPYQVGCRLAATASAAPDP